MEYAQHNRTGLCPIAFISQEIGKMREGDGVRESNPVDARKFVLVIIFV